MEPEGRPETKDVPLRSGRRKALPDVFPGKRQILVVLHTGHVTVAHEVGKQVRDVGFQNDWPDTPSLVFGQRHAISVAHHSEVTVVRVRDWVVGNLPGVPPRVPEVALEKIAAVVELVAGQVRLVVQRSNVVFDGKVVRDLTWGEAYGGISNKGDIPTRRHTPP